MQLSSSSRIFSNYLERYNLLDPLNEYDLHALHFVYIPRINKVLEEFQRQHNNHPLRTEHNMTPRQLVEVSPRSADADTVTIERFNYGVEEQGPLPDVSTDNFITVPAIDISLSPLHEALIIQTDPLHNDGNYGIVLFVHRITMITPPSPM